MSPARVLSIGQCGADHGAIVRTLHRVFAAEVVSADTMDEALDLLRNGDFSLVLVNRVFDADGASGVDGIPPLRAAAAPSVTPIMLVSNFPEAQAQAEQAGAVPGFGKSSLGHPAMLERIRPYLHSAASEKIS